MNLPRWFLLIFGIAAFGIAFDSLKPQAPLAWRPTPAVPPDTNTAARAKTAKPESTYQTTFISDGSTRLVHAPSLAQVGDHIVAVWFGGTREGATDVNLYADRRSLGEGQWATDRVAMTRQRTAAAQNRYIKKLGNAVLAPNADGSLSMFYVSVSLGGWATSTLNHTVSHNGGLDFEAPTRLVTTPFFNLSTLVKGTPLHYADDTIAVPVYHELGGKFGELLHVTAQGEMLDKSRITSRRYSLQPVVFPDRDGAGATALMRYCGKAQPSRVVAASSNDHGRHWIASGKTALPNPNSALSGVTLPSGEYLLVLNDTEDERNRLGLFATADQGKSFRVLHYFDDATSTGQEVSKDLYAKTLAASLVAQGFDNDSIDGHVSRAMQTMCSATQHTCNFQFDYPYLIRTSDGNFHVAYTWNKAFIKHVTFNTAWLEQRL